MQCLSMHYFTPLQDFMMADEREDYDCMLLYDSGRGIIHIEDTINEIKGYMGDVHIRVTLPQKMLPGDDVTDELASGMMAADVAIVMIDSKPSSVFSDLISKTIASDRRLRVIPLFCNMSEEEMTKIVVEDLCILSNTDTCLNSGNYLERLEEAIAAENSMYD